jgi:hypothetical protein
MRPYGSRDGAIPAAEVPPSLSQSQTLRNPCGPLARPGLEEPRRLVEGPWISGTHASVVNPTDVRFIASRES